MAGVARSTVYLLFGSRAGLFDAMAEDIFERSGRDRLVSPSPIPTPARACAAACAAARRCSPPTETSCAPCTRWPSWTRKPWGSGPAFEEHRARSMTWLARRLARQKALRPGVTQKEAAHVLWLLTGFDAFDTLYTGRGLSIDKVSELLIETAERTLCQ